MKLSWPASITEHLHRIRVHLRARPDSEFQQSLIRLAIGALLLLYFSSNAVPLQIEVRRMVYVSLFILFTFGVLVTLSTLISLKTSSLRRHLSMVLDFGVVSSLFVITGEIATPLLVIYLWVTLGYGFRYGPAYLFTAAAMALTGFLIVLSASPYWGTHPLESSAFLLSMIGIPLYTASLLKQLHGAVQREKNANHSKSVFLANMSHELRTPLNGVIGVSELLSATSLNKTQKEYSDIIRSSADTLLELIENVLDISRIEAGRLSSSPEDFDLHRLINGTTQMLEHQANNKGLILAAHIAPQTPFLLHGDARHLRQVIINLIGNAIKFTEHGRVDVYIRPLGQANPQRIRIEVVDTGIGIPEDVQERIFERFTQADASVTRRYGGTGLGTTIAKQLIEMMGGQIGLHSREGEGTTFWFELPLALQKSSPSLKPAYFENPMRVGILASSELADRLQEVIKGWGAEAVAVSTTAGLAAELSAYITGGGPLGAIVVERASLLNDPIEFLRILHDDPNLTSLPVILIDSTTDVQVTTRNEMHSDMHFIQSGFASVLSVPVNPTLLFNAIHAAVSRDFPANVISLAERFQTQFASKRLHILVAEDNPVNQRVICGLLSHAGFEVVLARDGEEALTMLESGTHFDLAIIDMHMPELSGPEVIQRWRFMESGHMPIIMLTADARADAECISQDAGADAFLTKPISSRSLIDMVSHLITQGLPEVLPFGNKGAEITDGVLDEAILEDLAQMGGGNPFVQELIDSFNEDSKSAINNVQRALTTKDYGLWQDQLHLLKGGASDVGAFCLARQCAVAERIKPFEISEKTAEDELTQVCEALAQALSALANYQDRKLSAGRS